MCSLLDKNMCMHLDVFSREKVTLNKEDYLRLRGSLQEEGHLTEILKE